MKALTVQQPWAWAIALGAKRVENRTQRWTYRGPLAIHAGSRISSRGIEEVPRLLELDGWGPEHECREWMLRDGVHLAAVLALATLADVHDAQPEEEVRPGLFSAACCDSVWAETSYAEHGGRSRRNVVHLALDGTRALIRPVPAVGRLGLWQLPPEVEAAVRHDLHAPTTEGASS